MTSGHDSDVGSGFEAQVRRETGISSASSSSCVLIELGERLSTKSKKRGHQAAHLMHKGAEWFARTIRDCCRDGFADNPRKDSGLNSVH